LTSEGEVSNIDTDVGAVYYCFWINKISEGFEEETTVAVLLIRLALFSLLL
jgi:hypothetical protein